MKTSGSTHSDCDTEEPIDRMVRLRTATGSGLFGRAAASCLLSTLVFAGSPAGVGERKESAEARGGDAGRAVGRIVPRMLRDVKASREAGKLVVSIVSDGPVSHEDFVLSNPPRLVMDFRNVENRIPFSSLPFQDSQVKQLRVRQFQATEPKITRMVFDLSENHGKYDVQADGDSLRVVFHETAAGA